MLSLHLTQLSSRTLVIDSLLLLFIIVSPVKFVLAGLFCVASAGMLQKKSIFAAMKITSIIRVVAVAAIVVAHCVATRLSAESFVRIDKTRLTLTLMTTDGDTLAHYPIACGRGYGQKLRQGDLRTPEGIFTIVSFTDASEWGHDFHDGLGYIRHAYGAWFIRLSAGNGIGIHGTHDPNSIGLRATEGCIRLRNDDLLALKPKLRRGMRVEILPERFEVIPCPPLVATAGALDATRIAASVREAMLGRISPVANRR